MRFDQVPEDMRPALVALRTMHPTVYSEIRVMMVESEDLDEFVMDVDNYLKALQESLDYIYTKVVERR